MKIFNWLQKRFPHNVIKDGLARNVKKTDSIAIDTNSKALLEQVALFDVLDGWRYGVLTIGTFGFDPLNSITEKNDHLALETNEDEEEADQCTNNNDDKEVYPLLFGHKFEDIEDAIAKRRTTLADLFYDEDSEMKNKPSTPVDSELNPCKKAYFCTKKGPFANKFVPQVGKDARPVKKLNQMMKRMLKRKIHPDAERKGNKLEGSAIASPDLLAGQET